jgi:hypothetical protein
VSSSTVVTPIRLYPLHCTLYLCTPTLTRRHLQALVALSHALVSDISFQFLRCALHWLQLRQLLKLPISLRNPWKFFFVHLILSVRSWPKLPQHSISNTFVLLLVFLSHFSHSSRPWAQPIDFYINCCRLTLFAHFYFCVSYFDLQTSFFCQNPISPFVFPCTTLL